MKDRKFSDVEAKELREARKERGLTQRAMADLLGVSMRMYNYYESGEKRIPVVVARALTADLIYSNMKAIKNSVENINSVGSTLTDYDMKRIRRLKGSIDDVLSVGSVDGDHLERILKQSSNELEKVLSNTSV
jgi:transcriptional regulator with XRE-family HTH domain